MKKYITKRNITNALGFLSFVMLTATQMLDLDAEVISYLLFGATCIGYFTNDDIKEIKNKED